MHNFVFCRPYGLPAGPTPRGRWDSAVSTAKWGSFDPSLSGSGQHVVFGSDASNVVGGDTNAASDIFVYDYASFLTTRVSVTAAGGEAAGASSQPVISTDGRYVAFGSSAANLVGADTNGANDIFVYDRTSESTTRVSVDASGGQANGASSKPSISGDGRYVAFRSGASNLVGSDTNGVDDIFLRDLVAGSTTRVSVNTSGVQANAASDRPAVSASGGFVAFDSAASNLVPGDTNGAVDVFMRSLSAGATTRESVTSFGAQASGTSRAPSISADGTRVAFDSTAALAAGDVNGASDVFVRDRAANTTYWASGWAANQGWQAGGASEGPAISGDGRYVALVLHSDVNLTDLNHSSDIYEYDLATDTWAQISRDDILGPGNKDSGAPALSTDGTYAAFESQATNFYADTNGAQDVFVHTWSGVPETGTPTTSAAALQSAAEEQPAPRPCSLGKPAAPSVPTGKSTAGATTAAPTVAVPTDPPERLSCRIRPAPPRIPCIFLPQLCAGPEGPPGSHRLGLELQEKDDTLTSEQIQQSHSISVRRAQQGLQALYEKVPIETNYPTNDDGKLATAIITTSEKLNGYPAGGGFCRGGTNIRREQWAVGNRTFRLDVVNHAGCNLTSFTG